MKKQAATCTCVRAVIRVQQGFIWDIELAAAVVHSIGDRKSIDTSGQGRISPARETLIVHRDFRTN